MSPAVEPPRTEPEPEELAGPDEVLVPEDDAIIGRAFRISLAAFALVGLAVAGLVWALREPPAETEPGAPEYVAPVAVVHAVTAPEVPFTDVTRAAGITFERENGARGARLLPETMGGGCAFLDFDGDGDPDLLLVNGAQWDETGDATADATGDAPGAATSALYANDGTGRFTDVTAAAGLDVVMQGMGCAAADVDGDGDPDLLLTGVGENRFMRNDGGRFVDATEVAGLAAPAGSWSTGAAFFDADGDGDLDLFVCRYIVWSPEIDAAVDYRLVGVGRAYGPPTNFEGTDSLLYVNQGDGTFVEQSAAAGIRVANPATGVPVGKALGVHAIDLDVDRDLDLLVANDTVQNFLFRNEGDGTFAEIGAEAGVAYGRSGAATGAMGLDGADYRNDGTLGFAIGNFANEMSSLYVTQGSGLRYTDESIVEGIGAPSRLALSFGVLFFDVDLDGRLDLLQVNGHLEEEISQVQPSQSYAQPAQLFWNAGAASRATFVPVPAERAGDLLARPLVGRGCAYADIDRDGDLDVVLTQSRGAPVLLRNDQALGHHWLRVRLEGRAPNRDAIGARVELEAGGVTQRRQVMPSRGYLSQVELPLTFGLGTATAVERLRVVWPDGAAEVVPVEGVDRELVVRRDR